MLRRYTMEQAAEKLNLDDAELRFLVHHFRELLSGSIEANSHTVLTEVDLSLLLRAYKLLREEGHDPAEIRLIVREEAADSHLSGRRQAEVLAFCSGRPGTGKSSIVINVATALVARGYRATIFDSDSNHGVTEYLQFPRRPDEWHTSLDSGVRVVFGEKFAELTGPEAPEEVSSVLEQQLHQISVSSDFILVDTGEGKTDNALRFAMVVDETIGVTTPDVGANADCFSVIRMLKDVDPDLRVTLLVNRALGLGDARESFARINGAAQKLGMGELQSIGWVAEDEELRKCLAKGEAVVDVLPTSVSARCISRLADHLVHRLSPAHRSSDDGLSVLVQVLRKSMYRGVQPIRTM